MPPRQSLLLLRCVYRLPRLSLRFSPCSPVPVFPTASLHHVRLASTHSAQPNGDLCAKASMLSPGSTLTGQSGHRYAVERVLQKKENSPLGVYIANCENNKYILKDVPNSEYLQEIYGKVKSCPHLRLPQDSIPSRSMYVYKFFSDDFLSLVARTDLPLEMTKRILKSSLQGIAALHDQNVVHNDIKPNNILVDRKDTEIKQVQLGDIEDAVIVPAGRAILGRQLGNWMWRSPEAHAEGPMNTYSDIFSFGIVCIYAVHKRVIFAVDESELGEAEVILAHVLERQISYFAELDDMKAFLEHICRSPYAEAFRVLVEGFGKENPWRPFALWKGVDPVLKDLVCKMTVFDPAKRITAHEALAHSWFEGI